MANRSGAWKGRHRNCRLRNPDGKIVWKNCFDHKHSAAAWSAPPDADEDYEPDEELVEEDGEVEEGSDSCNHFTDVPDLSCREARPRSPRCSPPSHRYPVWERKVRLTGETCLAATGFRSDRQPRLVPLEVFFTSPPALTREIIICGFVVARLFVAGRPPRRVSLPFQATFTAWPVHDRDVVEAEFLCFAGTRICPVLATSPVGRVYQAWELKVSFDAFVRVFHAGRPC